MKKILLVLLFVGFSLTSCDSNDDNSSSDLIGTWQLTSLIESGIDDVTECTKKTTLVLTEDEFIFNEYEPRGRGEECELDTTFYTYIFTDSTITIESVSDEDEDEDEDEIEILNFEYTVTDNILVLILNESIDVENSTRTFTFTKIN